MKLVIKSLPCLNLLTTLKVRVNVHSNNIMKGETVDNKRSFVMAKVLKRPKFDWKVRVFSHNDVKFAIRAKKSGDYYKINIVMFEAEEECVLPLAY